MGGLSLSPGDPNGTQESGSTWSDLQWVQILLLKLGVPARPWGRGQRLCPPIPSPLPLPWQSCCVPSRAIAVTDP